MSSVGRNSTCMCSKAHSNQALDSAHTSLPLHPPLHSPGVLHYLNGEYTEAVSYFLRVAENCQEYDEAVREPSIFNLGHAYRKQRDFDSAAHWYRAALAINPRVASTYSALGFTLHLRGDLDQVHLPQAQSTHNTTTSPPHHTIYTTLLSSLSRYQAIELYHQSLSIKPDDTFTCEMLSEALKDTLEIGDVTDLGGVLNAADPAVSMPSRSASAGASSSASAMDVQ